MRVAFILLIGLRTALCCTVISPSVKGAVKQADIVFRGTIAEIRDAEIVFQAERVWKGHIPPRFAMPRIVWSSTPCNPGFYEPDVRLGAELLVYARRGIPGWNFQGYVPGPGSRTALVQNALEDLRKLGRGRPPTTDVIRRPAAARINERGTVRSTMLTRINGGSFRAVTQKADVAL